jgi:S-DNA-T family DNA segregation ATPase FtsK/SpoIIIE
VHIVFRSAAGDRELDVELRSPGATLADLLQAVLGHHAPDSAAVGDRVIAASCPIVDSGLHEGAILSAGAQANGGAVARTDGTDLELVVVSGVDSGRSYPLTLGPATLGRERTNIVLEHSTISREHCRVDVDYGGDCTVTDLDSANGTAVDGVLLRPDEPEKLGQGGVLEVGALAVTVRPPTTHDRPVGLDVRRHVGPGGTVPFNRPPRGARPSPGGEIEAPGEPRAPDKPHFSVATICGPLILAVVMVIVMKDLRFALFAILSPLVAFGQYFEQRKRSTKTGTQSRAEYEQSLGEFGEQVAAAARAERARLRELIPDPAEVLRRAALPSVRLWERRPHHEDFLKLFAGLADMPWQPKVKDAISGRRTSEVKEELQKSRLRASPLMVDLSDGGVVGIVGDRTGALAAARSLICQAAVHHGPADLTIGVFVDPGREPEWDWCKWLPHTKGGSGAEQWLSARREQSDAQLRSLAAGAGTGTTFVVLDSDVLTEGKVAPARDLLRGAGSGLDERGRDRKLPVAGVVVASTVDRLPAACTTIVVVDNREGDAEVRVPERGTTFPGVLLSGLSVASARECARNLARFEDPELHQLGAGLPDMVRLLPLLDLERIDGPSVQKVWRRAGRVASPVAPLGVTESGIFNLDLIRDGPHGLIGGTTGSGKSELLRSLVAALATYTDPEHLTFVLMDYKGGAAFDECSRLPHTVGMVTDLDEQLGERALEALEAEVRYREIALRNVSVDNLRDYQALGLPEALPRLLVVIDEFATMAKELPEFLQALVSIAQRGRTLGVHLLLATQRPSGAVNDNIRTNTNLRIALRVQDVADSTDVIGVRDAAELSRHQPGRAYIRLGPSEIVPIQTALVTCVTDEAVDNAVDIGAFVFGAGAGARERSNGAAAAQDDNLPSDLARLVDAVIDANRLEGFAPARRPWPEPLGDNVDLADLLATVPAGDRNHAIVALADDPRKQAQYPVGWNLREGNLLLFGIAGSGTTTALASLALSLAESHAPDRLELYVLDYGAGTLEPLAGLPHTAAVVLAADRERQVRLLRHLRTELDRRRTEVSDVRIVVMIDNLAALRAEFDDAEGMELMEDLTRIYSDGPEVGIQFAVAADRLNSVHGGWMSVTTHKWLFRLPDVHDYASAGLSRKHVPQAVRGRAVMSPSGLQVQIGQPAKPLAEAVADMAARHPRGAARRAASIGVLPSELRLDELGAGGHLSDEPWRIPFGMRESDLDVAELVLYEGEHALVTGPARSGKSTALWSLAESVRAAWRATGGNGPPLQIVAVGGRRSPLGACPALDRYAAAGGGASALMSQLRLAKGPVVLLIDDAETFDDGDSAIEGLLTAAKPDLHIIAAGRADTLRSSYGHWSQTVRRSKNGILLRPNIDLDGDLVGVNLPRRSPVAMIVGRGYLAQNGEVELVQVAQSAAAQPQA